MALNAAMNACSTILWEQYFSCGGADDELAYDQSPVFEATKNNALIQFFRYHNGVARHQVGHVEAVRQQGMMIVIANCGAIRADDKGTALIAIARCAAGKPQVFTKGFTGLEDE